VARREATGIRDDLTLNIATTAGMIAEPYRLQVVKEADRLCG
jgi:hypothetical protein